MFRFLDGNRNTGHFKKLIKSIREIGILFQPILINERNEIVEGQGRFLALKALNLPIIFTRQNGIGINECRFLNSCSTNWRLGDYVHSYATGSDANDGAKYLELLHKEFPNYGYGLLYAAATFSSANGGALKSRMKNGNINITEKQYNEGRKVMRYIDKFQFVYKVITGRVECLQNALVFFFYHEDVDNEYLFSQMEKRYEIAIPPIATTSQAIEILESIYNFNPRSMKPIFIASDYKRWNTAKSR